MAPLGREYDDDTGGQGDNDDDDADPPSASQEQDVVLREVLSAVEKVCASIS